MHPTQRVADPSDVLCDDGGSGSEYSVCEYGSDCDDCGPRSSPPSPPPSSGGLCTNTCSYFNDDDCDDGGSNSQYSACEFGTDCADCGARSEEAASCDADCYSYTCDFWTTHGYACSTLEGTFGCDCSGCACAGTSSAAETSPVNNKKLMLQPHKPAVAGSHKPAVAGSKAVRGRIRTCGLTLSLMRSPCARVACPLDHWLTVSCTDSPFAGC